MSMQEWFIVFFMGSIAANVILRILLGKAYFLHKVLIEQGYEIKGINYVWLTSLIKVTEGAILK